MKSDDHEEDEIRAVLKRAFPKVDTELRRDLWPVFLRRLETARPRVPWYDWALAACLVASVFVFPEFVWFFAYQL